MENCVPERLKRVHEIFPWLECPHEDCIHYNKSWPQCNRCKNQYRNLVIELPFHPVRDNYFLSCADYQQKNNFLTKIINISLKKNRVCAFNKKKEVF
jgi:hypothetical protein